MSMWVFNRGVNPELTQEALESFFLLSLKESRKQIKVVLFIYLFIFFYFYFFIFIFFFHLSEFLREPTPSKKARDAWA